MLTPHSVDMAELVLCLADDNSKSGSPAFSDCTASNFKDYTFHLAVSTISLLAVCQDCRRESVRVHSRYTRQPADLLWSGLSVQLHLNIRRFYCDNPVCPLLQAAHHCPYLR
jgi:transposase